MLQFMEEKNFFKETVHNQKLFKYFDKKEFKKIRKYFFIKKITIKKRSKKRHW